MTPPPVLSAEGGPFEERRSYGPNAGGGVTMLVLAGPTGIGKSDAALCLAEQLPVEIVAVDSMQVYRGMEIGTGKPSPEIRRQIPHHGLDLVEPEEEFDVLRYVQAVEPAIREILARGRVPLLVAGCGLYLRILLRGLCEAPGRDLVLRERLIAQGRAAGSAALHARLSGVDPEAARRIHPNDLRRVVRALEVFEATGRPISDWQNRTPRPEGPWGECRLVGLTGSRDLLYRKIEERVDGWLASGWLEEARALSRRRLSRTAREALGYRELFSHLRGEVDWPATRALIHRNTRRYAKRQISWFRQERTMEWIQVDGLAPEETARRILTLFQDGTSAPRSRPAEGPGLPRLLAG